MKNFERITIEPAQMSGIPCVRHLRIPVATVLRLLAGGLSERESSLKFDSPAWGERLFLVAETSEQGEARRGGDLAPFTHD